MASTWRFSCFAVAFAGTVIACDGAESCPSHPCDPTSNGDPFDVIRWCEESGACLRNDAPVPLCKDADASSAPACRLARVDANETLSFPIHELGEALRGRRDLVVTYASCDTDAQLPDFKDVQILFDGEPAPCASSNPCDPSGIATVTTCLGVPSTVRSVTVSFTYDGAEGATNVQVEMQDATCSYFCS
jgi:hypothetical protein